MGVEAPSSGLGEVELEEAAEGPRRVQHRRPHPWRRRAIWAVAVMVVILIGLQLTGGYPANLTVEAAKPFNAFNDWVTNNQNTAPIFKYVLIPLRTWIQRTFDQTVLFLSRMTWFGVVVTAAALAGFLAGWRMSIVAAAGFLLMGVLGLWTPSIETLALVIFAVVIAVAIGVPVGIWAGRRSVVDRTLRPILDAMQTIPAFSYLVPAVLLFGILVPPALVAAVIFAIPPAIRLTSLGLQQVPETALEVGRSFGTTERQLLRKVQLPHAKPSVMLGVNQTIMMALGLIVIASSVGFGGLGRVVLDALDLLNVGAALMGGLAIVAMAIVLDRVTFAWSRRGRDLRGSKETRILSWTVSRRIALAATILVCVAGVVIGRQVLQQQDFPASLTVSIAAPVNSSVDWVTSTFGGLTSAISTGMITYLLNPLYHLLTDLPWWMVCGFAALIGWRVSRRWTLPVLAFVCVGLVGVIGLWDPAMNTLSQVIVAVVIAVALAVPIGIWSGRSDRVERILKPILDTMQTMPQFVYLVPAVALFSVGRVPAVIAALVYALPPGIRLTDLGIRQVPKDIVEASDAFGAKPWQTLWKVQVPLARPSILLGVNQTVIMVFSVVIIGGLVGGAGLGYLIVNGLSHDPGTGMVAGIAILLLAIVMDRITQAMGQAPPRAVGPAREPVESPGRPALVGSDNERLQREREEDG
jgi:glycine betaine/proline transport system permease protein